MQKSKHTQTGKLYLNLYLEQTLFLSRPITDLAVRVVATCSYIFEEVRVRLRRRVRRMVRVCAYATPYLLRAPDAEV